MKFINSVDFGIEIANDYYGGINSYYMQDLKQFQDAKNEAVNLLQIYGTITEAEIKEACENSFSGRLSYEDGQFEYTAGQFYDLEIPDAVLSVTKYLNNNFNKM